MGIQYKPGHPRKQQVAIVRERLLRAEPLYPLALIESGIARPSQVTNLLRRGGLPIVTVFEEEALTPEQAATMAEIDGYEEAAEEGEQTKTIAFYMMRHSEIERAGTDPDGQRNDMRLIYRMNMVKRRCASAVGLLKERGRADVIPADILRDSELPIPANTDGRSTISAEARAQIEEHLAEKRARIEAAYEEHTEKQDIA